MPNDLDALFAAIQSGDLPAIDAFLAGSPELAARTGPRGATPLLWACYVGQPDAARRILAHHRPNVYEAAALGDVAALSRSALPSPDERSADGWTALHLAAFFGRIEAARWLLDHGAAVDAIGTNASRNTPLHAAAAGRHVEVVRLLLGADANARQAGGYTALQSVARHGHEALVELLLAHGADPRLADDTGTDAIEHARAGGHEALAERLAAGAVARGAPVQGETRR